MRMTREHGVALAALLQTIRPEWQKDEIVAALHTAVRNVTDDLERVVAAAVRCAATPTVRRPDVIAMRGSHWTQPGKNDATPRPPRRDEQCDTHPGEWATGCRGCAADKLAGDPAPPRRRTHQPPPADVLARMHAELRSKKANLCTHGVTPRQCADCKPTAAPQEEG